MTPHFFINREEPRLAAIFTRLAKTALVFFFFLHNENILAGSHCCLALEKRRHWCGNWRGSRAGDESASTSAAGKQIASGCLEEKSVPKSSERKRDALA